MKWSLLIGKFWGTEIRLHASMLLLIPYTLLAFKPDSLGGMVRAFLLLTGIFISVALHELGHTLAARLYGIQVSSIILWPLGGVANLTRRPDKVLPDLVISAAGPLTNLILCGGLALLAVLEQLMVATQLFPGLAHLLFRLDVFAFLVSLAVSNLALSVFNLVPIYPLDGGQIARGVLKSIFGERRADFIMLVISLPPAFALTVIGLIMGDIALILTGVILVLASASLNLRLINGLALGGLFLVDRAGYHLKRLDFDPAVQAYTRTIQRHPQRAGAYLSRAVVYMNLMELAAARADIDQVLVLDPENYTAWGLRGELLSLDKNLDAAMAAYNRAIELQPQWAVAYLDRAGCWQERGDYDRAAADMDKGVELGRGSPVGYLLRSQLRYELHDVEGSRADGDQVLRYAPHWMLAFPEIFLTNFTGHLNWALDYYYRAIERMPKAYQVYQGRGDACRVNGRPGWAIEDYNRAIQLAPRQGDLFLARGRAYAAIGQAADAAADFHSAAQLADRAHIRRQANEQLARLSPGAAPRPVSLAASGPSASAERPAPEESPVAAAGSGPTDGTASLE